MGWLAFCLMGMMQGREKEFQDARQGGDILRNP